MIQELAPGGAERIVVTLGRQAAEAGHDVAVAAHPGPLGAEFPGPVYPLPVVARRPWLLPGAAVGVARALRGFRPDVVHAHNPTMALVAAPATHRGRRPPSLVTVHGVPDADYVSSARLLRLSGAEVVGCGPGVSAALEESGLATVSTIVNGIAPAPAAGARDALREAVGIPADVPLVIAVGRLVAQKNHALALEALAHLPGVHLAVVGNGPLRTDLELRADELGVAARLHLTGVRSDARALMSAADAVVLTSTWEGLPLVGLEALAAGTPLVATSVRGVRELLTPETGCILVDATPDAVAAGLRRVLSETELSARLSALGRRAATRYSEEAMGRAYLAKYEELAA